MINQSPMLLRNADGFRNESAALGELLDVVTIVRHRIRDTVRRKCELRFAASFFRDLVETLLNEFGVGRDKVRVVVERSDLVDFRSPFTDGFLSVSDVFAILSAA